VTKNQYASAKRNWRCQWRHERKEISRRRERAERLVARAPAPSLTNRVGEIRDFKMQLFRTRARHKRRHYTRNVCSLCNMRPRTCAGETSARARDHEEWLHCSLYPADSTCAGFLISEQVVRITELPPVILLGGCEALAEVSRGETRKRKLSRNDDSFDDSFGDSGSLVRDNFSHVACNNSVFQDLRGGPTRATTFNVTRIKSSRFFSMFLLPCAKCGHCGRQII